VYEESEWNMVTHRESLSYLKPTAMAPTALYFGQVGPEDEDVLAPSKSKPMAEIRSRGYPFTFLI
jgi:hypothetical protein